MPRFKHCIFYIFQLSTFLHFPFSGFPNYVFLVLLSPRFIWMHNSNQNIIVIKDDNMQGNSQIGFWRCLISCLLHYIHYLSIPLHKNSWDDFSQTKPFSWIPLYEFHEEEPTFFTYLFATFFLIRSIVLRQKFKKSWIFDDAQYSQQPLQTSQTHQPFQTIQDTFNRSVRGRC